MKLRKALTKDIEALGYLMKELSGRDIAIDQVRNRLEFVEESQKEFLFVCEDIDGKKVLAAFKCRGQRRVVMQAQVMAKPYYRCIHSV